MDNNLTGNLLKFLWHKNPWFRSNDTYIDQNLKADDGMSDT